MWVQQTRERKKPARKPRTRLARPVTAAMVAALLRLTSGAAGSVRVGEPAQKMYQTFDKKQP